VDVLDMLCSDAFLTGEGIKKTMDHAINPNIALLNITLIHTVQLPTLVVFSRWWILPKA
jgi:hypothetical protein